MIKHKFPHRNYIGKATKNENTETKVHSCVSTVQENMVATFHPTHWSLGSKACQ